MLEETDIDELLDAWEEAQERGESLSVEELCASRPDLRTEVERRIRALQTFDRQLVDDAATVDPDPTLQFNSEISQLAFHAKGGLGAVFMGQDQQLNRQVAIKFIHQSLANDPICRTRFQLEAEVTGRLEHPGVIPLYGVGQTQDGRPFYAMRYIDGSTLDQAIRRYYQHGQDRAMPESVEFRRLLTSFISTCETIAYAHNRGIVHRDIKPDNVMLGRYGETIVVDWGLAIPVLRDERFKLSGEQTLMPKTGSGSSSTSGNGAGTPAYMSPEQASELAPTPASDIYSLGATLFKILTGRPPVTGDSLDEVKRKVIEGRVGKPSELGKRIPKPLEAICLRAMSLHPGDRYATALDLARDVERFLADEPVETYTESVGQRFSRMLRRHRVAAVSAFAGLTGCLLLAGVSAFWLARSARNESRARISAETANHQAEQARRANLGTSSMFLAKSLAYEIDLRWRILEAEAASPQLRQLLQEVNRGRLQGDVSPDTITDLQRWLEKRWIAKNSSITTACWAIMGIEGTQEARVPEMVGGSRAASLGRNYRHRDYFHGEGRDLSPEELGQRNTIEPLPGKDVYISAVFQGSNTQTLMVTFSVPIWSGPPGDPDRQRIGVLCAPVELGDFSLGDRAILADTRLDQLNQRAGLVLHHPDLGHRSRSDKLHYLDQSTVEQAKQLDESQLERVQLLESFADPVTGRLRLAAIEPVLVRGRDGPERDTGWVVLVVDDT